MNNFQYVQKNSKNFRNLMSENYFKHDNNCSLPFRKYSVNSRAYPTCSAQN